MIEKSREHLESVHEDYLTHFLFAARIAGFAVLAGFVLLVHALIPAFFERTGSEILQHIHNLIAEKRQKAEAGTVR